MRSALRDGVFFGGHRHLPIEYATLPSSFLKASSGVISVTPAVGTWGAAVGVSAFSRPGEGNCPGTGHRADSGRFRYVLVLVIHNIHRSQAAQADLKGLFLGFSHIADGKGSGGLNYANTTALKSR